MNKYLIIAAIIVSLLFLLPVFSYFITSAINTAAGLLALVVVGYVVFLVYKRNNS